MDNYTTISKCRLCGSKDLEFLLSLGNHYVNDFPEKLPPKSIKCPVEMIECQNCSLIQLKHSAQQEILYARHYWYKSGINDVIKNDLKEIAGIAMKYMEKGDTILDIGANDGTFLSFVSGDYKRVGCEPADNLIGELRKHADVALHDFWGGEKNIYQEKEKAKVITAIGMFYDLEDPLKFVSDAKDVLHQDGIFIAQLMTAKPMVENNDLGNLCHEHLEFYHYPSLKYLFEAAGLEIYKIEENKINGGSYRIFARHFRNGSINYPESKIDWTLFRKNIEENREKCVSFIKKEAGDGKKIYAYGASTKGNTILQYYELGPDLIKGAADKDSEKYGKYMLTGIPIVPEEEGRRQADYFLILPYAFADMFAKREEEWLKKGGKFIVPLPNFRVLSS